MNNLTLEINKELVLSTCHVSEKVCNKTIKELLDNSVICAFDTGYGWRILLPEPQDLEYLKTDEDFPTDLYNLLVLAYSHDCKWLVLDCDGPTYDLLAKYEW